MTENNTTSVTIDVDQPVTKLKWLLVIDNESTPPVATLCESVDGKPGAAIESITLLFAEGQDSNLFEAKISVYKNKSFNFKHHNPVNFISNLSGLSCISLISLTKKARKLKFGLKCVLGEEASLTFNVSQGATGHFVSLDPQISIIRK